MAYMDQYNNIKINYRYLTTIYIDILKFYGLSTNNDIHIHIYNLL